MRPTSGLTPTSSSEAQTHAAPIAVAPTPRSSSRSGASTPIVPNTRPGTAISHMPPATRPSRAAERSSRGVEVPSGAAGSIVSATAASARPITPTAQKVGAMPTPSASVPSAGPASAPAMAAPIVVPIISPRRSRGAAQATQAMAPAHEAAPARPWTKRATSSMTIVSAKANAKLEALIRSRPKTAVARTPHFAAR